MKQGYCFGLVLIVGLVGGGCRSDSSESSEGSNEEEFTFTYEMAVGEWREVFESGSTAQPMRLEIYADRTMELYSLGAGRETPKPVESYENGVLKQMRLEQDDRFVEVHQLTPDRLLLKSYTAQGDRPGEWRTTRGGEETMRVMFELARVGAPYVAPVDPEPESSPGMSAGLIIAVVLLVLVVVGAVGWGYIARGGQSNRNSIHEQIRLRSDKKHLVGLLLITLGLLIFGWYTTIKYAGVILILAWLVGTVQARQMGIRWLSSTLIAFSVVFAFNILVLMLVYVGAFGVGSGFYFYINLTTGFIFLTSIGILLYISGKGDVAMSTLSDALEGAGSAIKGFQGGLPPLKKVRLRTDEARLVSIFLVIIVLGMGSGLFGLFSPEIAIPILPILFLAGAWQAASMRIRSLMYFFIGCIVISIFTVVALVGLFDGNRSIVYGTILLFPAINIGALLLYAEQYGIIHRLLNRGMPQSLKSRDTLDDWGQMIFGGEGMGETLWEIIIKHLEAVEAPFISWKYQVFAERVGLFTSKTKGISRKCLVVTSPSENFAIIVGAWDYGTYLAVRRLFWMRKVKKDDYRLTSEDFLRDDVSTLFRSAVHIAVTGALKEFIESTDVNENDIQDILQAW